MSRRWQLFAAFALLYILAYFYRVSLAVMATELSREARLSAAQLGTLSGAFFYAFALTQLPLGPLLDRFGGKRVALCCGLFTLTGLVIFTGATSYPTLLAGRILLGIGSASVLMSALRCFTHWFDLAAFGRISGFIIATGNLGNVAGTAPLAWAMSLHGWRPTFWAVAGIQVISLLLVLMLVREAPAGVEFRHTGNSPAAGLAQVVATADYWLLAGIAFFWYANYMAVQGLWGGPYLMEIAGLDRPATGNMLLAISLGFLVGCLWIGKVAEWLGSQRRTMLYGQTCLLCCMTLFLGPAATLPRPLLAAVLFLLGLSVASGVAIYPLIRQRFAHAITGTALTAVNFFILLGAAAMQQVMGWIINRFPRGPAGYPAEAYHQAFLLPIGGLALAIMLFSRLKESAGGNG
jgi:predicted MFS family arabinose efflux permease